MSTIPVQIKGSERVGYPEVERFERTVQKQRAPEGYMVAFSFSKNAYEEAFRARDKNGINIDLIALKEHVVPNPKFPDKPEAYTILRSEITKRTWGRKRPPSA